MKHSRKTWMVALLALVISGAGYWAWRLKEPVYEGKPLRYWVERLGAREFGDQPQIAILVIGTDAVPHLIRMLQEPGSPGRERYERFLKKLPTAFSQRLQPDKNCAKEAAYAVALLGREGEAAVPAVVSALLYKDPVVTVRRGDDHPFIGALHIIGAAAGEPLGKALLKGDDIEQSIILQTLTGMGTNGAGAVPYIITYGNGGDRQAKGAMRLLGSIKVPVEKVVGALCLGLDHESSEVRNAALESLEDMGMEAAPATARLKWMTEHDEPDLKKLAQDILDGLEKAKPNAVK